MRAFAFRASLIAGKVNVDNTSSTSMHYARKALLRLFEDDLGSFTSDWYNSSSFWDDYKTLTSNWTQVAHFDGESLQTVYKANWWFVGVAVFLSFISILSLTLLFWGWWELGRDVSLNPLEIAMAFDSSLLKTVNSNSRRSQLLRTVGSQKIKYGVETFDFVEEALEPRTESSDSILKRLCMNLNDSYKENGVTAPKSGDVFT
jgi:hypothetical protein